MILEGLIVLTKLTMGLGCIGLGSKVLLDLKRGGYLHFMLPIKQINSFNIGNEHATVIGLTQHGKTFGTIRTMNHFKEGVLFFNCQHEKVGSSFITATPKNTPSQIITALKQGKKINYVPSDDSLDQMSKELGAIINNLYTLGRLDCRIVVDEVQLFWMAGNKDGKNALLRLATTGLGRGFKCMFLSQRPAKVDNTLYTQSTKHIIFALGKMDISYLKQNGFPVEEIVIATRNEKYNFVEFNQKEVSGAYRIKP